MAILSRKNSRDKRVEAMKAELSNPKSQKKLTLMLDESLLKSLKRKALDNDVTMTLVVTKLIKEYVKSK